MNAQKAEMTSSFVEAGIILVIFGAGGWAVYMFAAAYALYRFVPDWAVKRLFK